MIYTISHFEFWIASSNASNFLIMISLLISLFVIVRVWNEAVAHRLSTLGHRARRGDLVWLQEGQNKLENTSSAQVRA